MRLLVVEDEPQLLDSLARGLRSAGHAVDGASTIGSALDKLARDPYDGVVLDLNLPDGSGLDLARRLRQDGAQLVILALTAYDSIADRVAGLDAGADDYLVKPFALDELLARLRALERRQASIRPSTLVIDDLVIDPAARTAARGGQPIELTTTEFSLLEFLAKNAGQVVGRATISAHVWDENYDPLSNIIDVYIARLRRKLDTGGAPLLHTIRGAGYVLRPEYDDA
ncbi:MAG: response regulator transcription factor [Gemmatimonadales bacterium]|nr:response regulator transcription factor [Gemmatimonadales bacterium]